MNNTLTAKRSRSIDPEIRDPRATAFKIPSFASKIERELTPIEKTAIQERFSGMDEPTQREILRHISTELINEEYRRREKVVKATLGDIRFKITTGLRYDMTPEQMKALLDDILTIVREGSESYGNK